MATETPAPAGSGPDGLMAWPDLTGRPRPAPDDTIRYGDDSMQVVDLWLPPGRGPHPVVLMVHGGCWQTEIADRRLMDWAAADLRGRGIAVWNIDYRGVDRDGGGYPGTFLDAAAAADALREHAPRYNLAINNLVAVGHSAGGHLAGWLGARRYANERARTLTVRVRTQGGDAYRDAIAARMMEALERLPGATMPVSESGPGYASALVVFSSHEAASALVDDARQAMAALQLELAGVEVGEALPAGSPLLATNPIDISKVVLLGAIPDLEIAAQPPGSGCGTEVIGRLTGGRFADTSLPRLAPLAIEQVLINGREDRIIPVHFATSYAEQLRAVQDHAEVRFFDRTGHVELITPGTAAWEAAVEEIERGLWLR